MELQLKGDDVIRFRNDFTEIWKQLDVSFKAQMGARVVRDLLYSKLKGSQKLRDVLKEYENVSRQDTPKKYNRIRTLSYLWRSLSRWEEKTRRARNDDAILRDQKKGALGFYDERPRKPSAPSQADSNQDGSKGKGKGKTKGKGKSKWNGADQWNGKGQGNFKQKKVRRPRPKSRARSAPAPEATNQSSQRSNSQARQSRTGTIPTCPAQSKAGKCPPCNSDRDCVSFWTSGICNSPETCKKQHVRPNGPSRASSVAPAPENADQSAKAQPKAKKVKKTGTKRNKPLVYVQGAGPAPAWGKKGKGKGKVDNDQKDICFHWQQTGTCPYGATCRYRHGPIPSAAVQVKARQAAKDGGYHYYSTQ